MIFATDYQSILGKIDQINPVLYGKTRNYIDGAVTKLSPYVSRGVISTKQIYDSVLQKGYKIADIEPFIKELAWRDYFQRVLQSKPDLYVSEIKNQQSKVINFDLPHAILYAETGIETIDNGIKELYHTGYMHNHLRMYTASLACNVAQSHWRLPARWMYYFLLDADVASNFCSWQWVCGANSSKKYYANQENINKYGYTNQKNTFLDIDYEQFETLAIPAVLKKQSNLSFDTNLPTKKPISVDKSKPTLVYNFYNLDPNWHKNMDYNRVLILEPSHFKTFPISEHTLDFVLLLSKNIPAVQVYIGEFEELKFEYLLSDFIFKEHPLFNYTGICEPRDWIFEDTTGYFPSFFSYWNTCVKSLDGKA